jgi:hypothetical protein
MSHREFSLNLDDPKKKQSWCIKLEGKIIHRIVDLREFHQALGYTEEIAKSGLLPDEFLWEKFINNAATRCKNCFQLHLFQYLMRCSAQFRIEFEAEVKDWTNAFALPEKECTNSQCEIR